MFLIIKLSQILNTLYFKDAVYMLDIFSARAFNEEQIKNPIGTWQLTGP